MLVYPNTDYLQAEKLDSPIFLEVERQFNSWIDSTNPALEYEEMYFGADAIYSKKEAIRGAISEIIDEAIETGQPVNIMTFDFDAIFQ